MDNESTALLGLAGFFIPILLRIEDRKRPGQESLETSREAAVEEGTALVGK